MIQRFLILALCFCAVACHRRLTTSPGPTPEELFQQGLKAFHQGTPESYQRAVEAFGRASKMRPAECSYALNQAQSLLFLSAEQELNFEKYEPSRIEAASIVDAIGPACVPTLEPFVLRLRALIAGRGVGAANLINRAVELDATDAMNWVVLGYLDPTNSHLVTADGVGRWIAMTRAVQLQPDSALIQFQFGKNYQSSHRPENEARNAFNRAIEISPQHYRSYLNLAYLGDDNTDVETLYQKVVQIAPDFVEGRIAAGSYYGSVDEIEKAAGQYSAVLATHPKNDVAEFRMALLMLQAERPQEAEKHFRAVTELNSSSFEAWYYLGNLAYNRNDFDEAKKSYQRAVDIRSDYAEAEFGIGLVYRRQNQLDMALAQFDKTIRISPRGADAYVARAEIRAEQGHLAEAVADFQSAIDRYHDLVKSLSASIASLRSRGSSRLVDAEIRRVERDRSRTEALLVRVGEEKSDLDKTLNLPR
jgi:tetratricopeptide (TPR) repeat protein